MKFESDGHLSLWNPSEKGEFIVGTLAKGVRNFVDAKKKEAVTRECLFLVEDDGSERQLPAGAILQNRLEVLDQAGKVGRTVRIIFDGKGKGSRAHPESPMSRFRVQVAVDEREPGQEG